MLPGELIGEDVMSFTTRVVVAGVKRGHVSVDLRGEMRADLPSQLVASSNSFARSGTIVWEHSEVVQSRPVTAFNDFGYWRPRKGDPVVVYQGDGASEWPRFTGLIDETTGTVGEGMQSTIVANVDPLSEDFECEALLSRMPPRSGSSTWRWGGLSPMYFIDAALRAGSYYVTPPTQPSAALNLPLQSSMLPAAGTNAELISGGSSSGDPRLQANWPAPWGLSAADLRAEYGPAFTRTPSQPVSISMMFTEAHSGRAYVAAHYGGSTNYYLLMVSSAGNAIVQRMADGALVEVCRLSASQLVGAYRVEVLFKTGRATLRASNGATATSTFSSLSSAPMSRVEVSADADSRIAGVQVYHPEDWQEFATLNFEPTARIHTHVGNTDTWGITNASPRFEKAEAQSVLEELADQTLSAVWFDEGGVLNVGPSGGMRGRASMQTLTTADDVLALSWSDRLLAVASRVTVGYLHPALKSATTQSIEVARGSRQTMNSGNVLEDVYTPASDVDWYGVDEAPDRLPDFGWSEYNGGIGSYTGVTYYTGDDPAVGEPPGSTTITVSKTGLHEYTIIHEAGNYGSGVVAETMTYPEYDGSTLWERNRSQPLPVLQAWGLVRWIERETTRKALDVGPALRVNLGGQATVETAQRVRDYLHDLIVGAFPQITSLGVTPDPRRQLGDIITLASENYLGVRITGMVTGLDEGMAADWYTQSVSLEVLDVNAGALTYQQWEQAFPGTLTHEQWRSLRDQADDYDDFNTDPLRGA